MRGVLSMVCVLILGVGALAMAASDTGDSQKAGPNKGLTLEDIGRGLKSAAKNIGDEIPKIGPAIGDTFKKVTDKDKNQEKKKESSRPPAQNSTKDKK